MDSSVLTKLFDGGLERFEIGGSMMTSNFDKVHTHWDSAIMMRVHCGQKCDLSMLHLGVDESTLFTPSQR